jgi:pimeloyl-ACP methyl ester carboxylesterase
MTTTVARGAISTANWNEPDGLKPRGTVFVVASGGEPPQVYARLGARLAADAYRVVVISSDDALDAGTQDAIAALVDAEDAISPRILVGSDVGALAVRALAGQGRAHPAAVVLAGYPTRPAAASEWQDEIEARTACPTHRGVLSTHAEPVHRDRAATVDAALDVPILAVHGSADTIAPLDEALEQYCNAGAQRVVVVDGGRHDILNDLTHRSVAATIVVFLEQVKAGSEAADIVRTVDLSKP